MTTCPIMIVKIESLFSSRCNRHHEVELPLFAGTKLYLMNEDALVFDACRGRMKSLCGSPLLE